MSSTPESPELAALRRLIQADKELRAAHDVLVDTQTAGEETKAIQAVENMRQELMDCGRLVAAHGPGLLSRLEWLERVAAAAKKIGVTCADVTAATELYGDDTLPHDAALAVMYAARAELAATLAAEPGNGEPK